MNYELTLHETPKSLNPTMGGGWDGIPWPYIKAKKKWEGMFQIALMQHAVPRHQALVVASAELTFPQKRDRDEGNFRFMLEKALGDTLVAGGWIEDDTPDSYRFERVTFNEERGDPLTIVRLEVEE